MSTSMSMSVRLSPEEKELFQSFAKMHGLSMSELVRRSVMERIEDDHDLRVALKALEEYKDDPVTYSHDEVRKMLGFD